MKDKNLKEIEGTDVSSETRSMNEHSLEKLSDNPSPENGGNEEHRRQLDATPAKYGRLMLFIKSQDLQYFSELLSVSDCNTDVVRAVRIIGGGKIPSSLREKEFLRAVMPHLYYTTTFNSLYAAFNRA